MEEKKFYNIGPGHFGLWRFCTILAESNAGSGSLAESATSSDAESVRCVGRFDNFASILSPAFRASTVFVGLVPNVIKPFLSSPPTLRKIR
jgi:hypothetical protein